MNFMSTLEISKKKREIIRIILNDLELFKSFDFVYLFGSLVKGDKKPSDVDLLLIYKQYSDKLLVDIDKISIAFKSLHELSFDFTVISENEEKEINFINRLDCSYIRIK